MGWWWKYIDGLGAIWMVSDKHALSPFDMHNLHSHKHKRNKTLSRFGERER